MGQLDQRNCSNRVICSQEKSNYAMHGLHGLHVTFLLLVDATEAIKITLSYHMLIHADYPQCLPIGCNQDRPLGKKCARRTV